MKMRKPLSVQELIRYSLLASLAAVMQLAPAFIPGPGHFLSAFGTLPVALAAYLRPLGGAGCAFVSAWLIFIIQPGEAPILVLCTGPLGLIIGWGLHHSLKTLPVIFLGAVALSAGILVLTFIVGIPAFGSLIKPDAIVAIVSFTWIFSFLYSWSWYRFTRTMLKKLSRMGLILYTPKHK